jgi:uncharacterized protein
LAVEASWILEIGTLYAATFLISSTALGGMGYFLTYAVLGAFVLGFGVPIAWTFYIRKRSIAGPGLTTKRLARSLVIQLAAAGIQLALALTRRFFEAVFWRGWVQTRLMDGFGVIPGILLGSALYAIYHVGYGMDWSEMLFLIGIGIMFAMFFRIARSVFILLPVFQLFGQLMNLVKDKLDLPWAASLGIIDVLAPMITVAVINSRMGKQRGYES